jgi:(p)ppGpp synthase/HD superfamily hydrolase
MTTSAEPRLAMTGYSDRINHALAFAAKHHDQRVRRGTRPPYSTQPANLALILTRYGCDEDTVTAGILLDAVKDYAREGFTPEALQQRIGEKFGSRALEIALMVSERKTDADGMELSSDERRDDLLDRLGDATPEGRFLAAAEALHLAGTLLADLRRTVEVQSVWSRVPGGRERAIEAFRRLHGRLADHGLRGGIHDELGEIVAALAALPT